MREYWQLIDTNTDGPRYDVTPIFKNHAAFKSLIDDIVAALSETEYDLVAGIDALGFVLAGALSTRVEKGLILIRKGKKLPTEVDSVRFTDYTGDVKTLEIRKNTIPDGSNILLVDEWVETGAQAKAASQLIESQGGNIAAIVCINIDENGSTKTITDNYNCISLAKIKGFDSIL